LEDDCSFRLNCWILHTAAAATSSATEGGGGFEGAECHKQR
jgi:hypothetical protein